MKTMYQLILAALFLVIAAGTAAADGFIVVHPPRPGVMPLPLAVKYHHVKTDIRDRIATTEVDQVFVNPNNMRLEGTYLFPLPAGAAVSRMSMWIDGKEVEGEMLPRDEADRIYTEIVRSMKDPAILEYMGTGLFRMRVFPIEPRGEKRIRISYTETVPADAGLCTYRYPLSTEKFSSAPLQEVVITTKIGTTIPLKAVFSPSHEVDVSRKDDFNAVVGFEQRNVTPDKDFILYYTLSESDIGASAVTFRRVGEDGYFALFVAPAQEAEKGEVVAKDVIFVIDTSGSMKEPDRKPWKIDQAKAALKFCVKSLNAGDRFNVVTFATAVRTFRHGLQPASEEIVAEALGFIDGIKAGGGTNIQAALDTALGQQGSEPGRPFMVVFLTDGLPTVGDMQDAASLVALAGEKAGPGTRLFAFGVGYDVNTHLLDKLALDTRGERIYVLPEENIEVKVSSFYDKISSPVMSDVAVSIEGLETYDVFPPQLPDLFRGSQLVVYGRYRGCGSKAIKLRGQVNGKPVEHVCEAGFAEKDSTHSGIPRLWASSKIGYLLDQLRLKGIDVASGRRPAGPDKEIVDEIVTLATEFGIVTPYTALLVLEDVRTGRGRESPVARRLEAEKDSPAVADELRRAPEGFKGSTGRGAVEASQEAKKLRGGLQSLRSLGYTAVGRAVDAERTIRQIADKTFILNDGIWYDSAYREGMETEKVAFLGEAYFELVQRLPKLARYLSAGARTVVCLDGTVYEIVVE